ncbi:hypothetical protein AB6D92_25945, partial [Vibrio splendidus]
MKYTKRSLVGLFTLSIMQSGVAQAANNTPYPFGEEFVYHTCPSGFDKQGMSCLKPASLKCDAGYSLDREKKVCTKITSVTYKCPTGSTMQGNKCSQSISEKGLINFGEGKTTIAFKLPNRWQLNWKGAIVYEGPNSSYLSRDGWLYKAGAHHTGYYDSWYNILRTKDIVLNRLEQCPSGYRKQSGNCRKQVTAKQYCPSGSLNSGRCVVSPLRHSPVEETMATLYPRYSDDAAQQNAAAFRYL